MQDQSESRTMNDQALNPLKELSVAGGTGGRRLSVIGLGYIGLPTAATFASTGKAVVGIDISQRAVDAVNAGQTHIEEDGLPDLVAQCVRNGSLRAATAPEPADDFIIAV